MQYGIDYLGGARYGDTVVEEHPAGWAAGFFSKVDGFGDSLPIVDRLLGTGRCTIIRLHLQWRDRHDFSERDFASIVAEARRCAPLVAKYPNVRWYISGACEHKLNAAQAQRLADLVLGVLPGVIYVNTPMRGGADIRSPRCINEHHKEHGGRCEAFSYDGVSCVDADVEKDKATYSAGHYFMFWAPQCNGKRVTNDTTPRAKRKYWPVPKQIDSWIYLSRERGPVRLSSDIIFKSHSDQHTNPPRGKDQKPVVITPMTLRPKRLQLKTKNGQVVATSTERAPYNEKKPDGSVGKQVGWRYYFETAWGMDHAEKARRIGGSPVCILLGDGRKIGEVNPAFRCGKFR